MSASLASEILVAGILAFVGTASAMLVWNGLAGGLAGRQGGAVRHARARIVVGVLGFGLALWIALGFLTHVW